MRPVRAVNEGYLRVGGNVRCAWKIFAAFSVSLGLCIGSARSQEQPMDGDDAVCPTQKDVLSNIRCKGTIRVGVRGGYPGFGTRVGDGYEGYDIEVARLLARELGVKLVLAEVTPSNRVQKLASGSVDAVIATMSHTTSRQREVHFVRPHYYAAHTSIVGTKDITIRSENDLAGREVCTTLGHFSNLRLSEFRSRVSVYENGSKMLQALQSGVCSLAMQDSTFFIRFFQSPDFGGHFETKLTFDFTPWGIAVGIAGTDRLLETLNSLVARWLRDGILIELARRASVPDEFLRQQRFLWSGNNCWRSDGTLNATCTMSPFDDEFIR